MVGYVLCIFAMGTIIVSSIEYAYGVLSGRKVTKEFAEAGLVLFLKLRSGCHSEIKKNQKYRARNGKIREPVGAAFKACWLGRYFSRRETRARRAFALSHTSGSNR